MVRSYVVDDAGSAVKAVIPAGEPEAGTYLVTWSGHGDALGLWRQNADGTLTLANSYTYDTWGRPTTATHNAIGDLGFRFTYVGEFDVQWDDAFGLDLLYMHARHYSPTLGRFLTPDPDGSESNLYAYTANNPVTELDPDGTCFILCAIVNAVIDTAIYLATTDSSNWDAGEIARTAATGAVTGFLGVGLLSKVGKVGGLAVKVLTKVPKAGRGLQRAIKRVTSRPVQACARHSFDGDTLVTMANGTQVPINELAVGEQVLAWDEQTGRTQAYPVTATWVHDDAVTGFVIIDDEAIATTPGHPFFAMGRGWVEASDLVIGDRVPSASGETGTVEALSWSRGQDRMYDLTVAIAHTFYVGDGGWLVHNCNPVHGNSLASKRPTTLYKAYDKSTGTFQKWGITSNLARRYSASANLRLVAVRQGSRRSMSALERRVVQRFRRAYESRTVVWRATMIDIGSIAFGPEVEQQPIITEISRLRVALMSDSGSPTIEVVFVIPGSLGRADFERFEIRRSRSANGRVLVYVAVPPDVATSHAPMPALVDLAKAAIEFGTMHVSRRRTGTSNRPGLDILLAGLAKAVGKLSEKGRRADEFEDRHRGSNLIVNRDDQHEVGITIRLALGDRVPALDAAFELEDRLAERLAATGSGYVDGNEVGEAAFEIFAYGSTLPQLRADVEHVIRKHWVGMTATVRVFDGDDEISSLDL